MCDWAGNENRKNALNPLEGLAVLDRVGIDFYSPGAGRHCQDVNYPYRELLLEVEHIKSQLLGVSQPGMFRVFPPSSLGTARVFSGCG